MAPQPDSKRCPYCGKQARDPHAPFCSRGCKDRDLLKWMGDGYRIGGPPADPSLLGGVDSESDEG